MTHTVEPQQAESPFILTLDIGTSSTRAMLFDRLARPVAGVLAQLPNDLRTTAEGGAEFEPADLLATIGAVLDQALDQVGSLADQLGGVALDTLVTNMLGLDQSGQPVTPLLTYADTRSAPAATMLRRELAAELAAISQRTGCPVHSAYWPARFHWLAHRRPDWLKAAACWVSLGEYLGQEFFGQRLVSFSVASWTGLLNRFELGWDQAWLSYLSLDERLLSPLADTNRPLRGLSGSWAERWPALKEVPWFPAVADGAAANLGSGCDTPQRVALTMGTTGAMRVVLEQTPATVPAGLWVYQVDRRRPLLGGATSEGGNVFAWLKETLQLPPDVEGELARLSPAAHGLTVLPFVAGERAPGWQGQARASLINFTLHTRPIEILRASLEGVAYRFALIHQRIAPHLPPDHQIIASGSGLLNSLTWLQMMADVLGRPLVASAEQEATSRGAALLALEALGLAEPEPAATGQTYLPNPEHHTLYQEALTRQVDFYNAYIKVQ